MLSQLLGAYFPSHQNALISQSLSILMVNACQVVQRESSQALNHDEQCLVREGIEQR